ncbi:hypothetical protein VPH35_127707 [Triticum aestivum]
MIDYSFWIRTKSDLGQKATHQVLNVQRKGTSKKTAPIKLSAFAARCLAMSLRIARGRGAPRRRRSSGGRRQPRLRAERRLCVLLGVRSPPDDIRSHELCVVRRTGSMADLERRLQFAMVAYVGGARHDISPEFVLQALEAVGGVEPEWVSVHCFRPEDFLVVFARQEHRNLVAAKPFIEFQGIRLFFRQWNRQAQAVHSQLNYKVSLVIEGIPPHAWEREIAEDLLGTSCLVDMVAPESSSRRDLSAFKLTAWTAEPDSIPSLRWLAIPEPGLVAPLLLPPLLQYKVLIHLDSVADYSEWDEPLFLGVSSGSDQSGVSSDGRISGGAAPAVVPRRLPWHFGARDSCGQGVGSSSGKTPDTPATGDSWCLPPMENRMMVTAGGVVMPIRDRLSVRTSAFDRLTMHDGVAVVGQRNLNLRPGNEETVPRQPISAAEVDRLISPNGGPSPQGGPADTAATLGKEKNQEAVLHLGDATAEDPLLCPIIEQTQTPPVRVVDPTQLSPRGEEESQHEMIEHRTRGEDDLHLGTSEHQLQGTCMQPEVGPGDNATAVDKGDKHIGMTSQVDLELNASAPAKHLCDQEGGAASEVAGGLSTEIFGETRRNVLASAEESQQLPIEGECVLACDSLHGALHGALDVTTSRAATSDLHRGVDVLESRPCTEMALYEREILSEVHDSVQQGMTASEALAFAKLKAFCSCIVKKLAPPLLKEIQASTLHPAIEPCTPRRTTRATKRIAGTGVSKAPPAENVLLRTLGIAAEDLTVDDRAVEELKGLFDSPLREQHIRVIAALFGKTLPLGGALAPQDSVAVSAQ